MTGSTSEQSGESLDEPAWLREGALALITAIGSGTAPARMSTARQIVVNGKDAAKHTQPSLALEQMTKAKNRTLLGGGLMLDSKLAIPFTIASDTTAAPLGPKTIVNTQVNSPEISTWVSTTSFTFADLPPVWNCITKNESAYQVVDTNTKSGTQGAFQIEPSVWLEYRPLGYPDTPNAAILEQQYHVALLIWHADGFHPWVTASLCGV